MQPLIKKKQVREHDLVIVSKKVKRSYIIEYKIIKDDEPFWDHPKLWTKHSAYARIRDRDKALKNLQSKTDHGSKLWVYRVREDQRV